MENKQRIGLMTFWRVNNYGAVLQAYSLSSTLTSLGFKTEIIDYKCDFLEKPYGLRNLRLGGFVKYLTSLLGYLTRLPRNRKFKAFRMRYLNTSSCIYNNSTLENCKYSIMVVGSDQVWNLDATGMDTGYLLDSIPDSVHKYSYAASFGVSEIKEAWKSPVKEYLGKFEGLTVREEAGKEAIGQILPYKKCEVMIDPVFLTEKSEWLKIAEKPKCQNYILVYQQSITKTVVRIAKKIAKERKLKILFIPFPIGEYAVGKCKTNYSPEEWLGLIANASYVITDSFHGVALSIIMNKKFYTNVSGTSKRTGGRISELLGKMGLQDRYIDDISGLKEYNSEIDYERVNKKIGLEREKALLYLRELEKL